MTPEDRAERLYGEIIAECGQGGAKAQLIAITKAIREAFEECAKIAEDGDIAEYEEHVWELCDELPMKRRAIAAAIMARINGHVAAVEPHTPASPFPG